MPTPSARRGGPDDGAVVVLVSVFLSVGVVFLAFVVDLGRLRDADAQLAGAVDAAALGAAHALAAGEDGCGRDAPQLLQLNDDAARMASCLSGAESSDSGWVTVSAERTVPYQFGAALGISAGRVSAQATARFTGTGGSGGGGDGPMLRPLGLCADNVMFRIWQLVGAPPDWYPVRITYESAWAPCPYSDGEFLVFGDEDGVPPASRVRLWNRDSYPHLVSVGDLLPTNGQVFTNGQDFDALVGERVVLVLFDDVVETSGNGRGRGNRGTSAQVSGFVVTDVLAVDATGRRSDRSITVRFVEVVPAESCCGLDDVGDGSAAAVYICDVDGTKVADCRGERNGS